MNKSIIRYWTRHLAAGWIGELGLILSGQAVLAEPASTPQITVYVYNWAEVEPDTLQKAKEIAARVFRNAGVEAKVLDAQALSDEGAEELGTSILIVHAYSPAMAKRLRFPATVLGLAPGTAENRNRTTVYVFDHVAAKMAQELTMARMSKIIAFSADKAQILGYAIAHEIGHVLLHQDEHSRKGIMQANWDRYALANIAMGRLSFNSEEVAGIQAEVARRGIQE